MVRLLSWRSVLLLCGGTLLGVGGAGLSSYVLRSTYRINVVDDQHPAHSRQIYQSFFGHPPRPSVSEAQVLSSIPQPPAYRSLKARFIAYAQRDPVTGEYVQKLEDFVACMLLFSPTKMADGEGWLRTSPSGAQERLRAFFKMVDIDQSKGVNYAEFVVLFTLLSTRYQTLQLTLQIVDEENKGSLGEVGLTRLLNTVMVDPAVQIVNDSVPEASNTLLHPRSVNQANWGETDLTAEKERAHYAVRKDLSFTISSSSIFRWLVGVHPNDERAPPGSHYHSSPTVATPWGKHVSCRPVATTDDDSSIAFEALLCRIDFLRWELRAIEFGLFDPSSSGLISVDACRRILYGVTKEPGALSAAVTEAGNPEPVPCISWQFYRKVFEIIRAANSTLPALQLALDAAPPVLPEDLVNGAIKDDAYGRSRALLQTLAERRQVKEQRDDALQQLGRLVRPTALTWRQFNHVLDACQSLPILGEEEQKLFFELFDGDRSGTITPSEFAVLSDLKRSFFADRLPDFTGPRRNAVQQFFYCMQQLV